MSETKRSEPRITNVYAFANGMCAVFDQHGKQMPEFQGQTAECLPKIREVYSGHIEGCAWGADSISSDPELTRRVNAAVRR